MLVALGHATDDLVVARVADAFSFRDPNGYAFEVVAAEREP